MQNTILSYWDDSYQFEDNSKILEIQVNENGQKYIVLDHTIMYPQGGGQPYDIGEIENGDNIFIVKEVRFKDGIVYHIGEFQNTEFANDVDANVKIDPERRKLHAKLHTAGHLVDDAMFELGYTLEPSKGYHFPDGPYVEYIGAMDGDLNEAAKKIEEKINEIIGRGFEPYAEIVPSVKDLEGKVMHIPTYIPEGKPVRIVYASSPSKGQPCGGTHVKNLKDINHVSIPKIKVKGGITKISYLVN